MKLLAKFDILSIGLCYMTVCTNVESPIDIEKLANAEHPSGVSSPWRLSTDKNFATGHTNPCACEHDGGRKHYLLSC